jgi:hypothetical protein
MNTHILNVVNDDVDFIYDSKDKTTMVLVRRMEISSSSNKPDDEKRKEKLKNKTKKLT